MENSEEKGEPMLQLRGRKRTIAASEDSMHGPMFILLLSVDYYWK